MNRIGGFGVTACAFATLSAVFAAVSISTKPVRTFERPEGEVVAIAFTPDGRYLCAGGEKGVVYSWDADSGEIVNRTTAHLRAAVLAVATYPLAPFAVHASELGIKFNLIGEHGKVPTFPFVHRQTVQALDFSKDGNYMASGDRGGEVIVWNLWTGQPYRRLQTGKDGVNSVRYHQDGNRVAIATNDGKLRLWDTRAEKILYETAAHEGPCNSVAFSPDGQKMATGGKDKKVKLWNTADGKPVTVLEGHQGDVNAVVFQPKSGLYLASASDDKTVKLWDLSAKKVVQTLPHENAVNALSWRPDGAMLATGSGTKVQLFEASR